MSKCRRKILLLFCFQLFFLHLAYQSVRHPVKAPGQFSDLICTLIGSPLLQISLGNPPHRAV